MLMRAFFMFAAAVSLLFWHVPAIHAEDPPVSIDENAEVVIVARDPGSSGRPARRSKVSSGPTRCIGLGVTVPCAFQGHSWNHTHQCYDLGGDSSGRWCMDATSLFFPYGGPRFRRIPPAQADVELPDPGQMARTAVEHMNLQPVSIATSPGTVEQDPGALSYVGWNMWLWNSSSDPASVGPITESVSAGGYTVTATAKVDHVVWEMGDGGSVSCATATAWEPRFRNNERSPDCGYVYQQDGEYVISATTHWVVQWQAPGAQGSLTVEVSESAHLLVAEAHMLNVPVKRR